jgi:two-component system OmpR family response regulator
MDMDTHATPNGANGSGRILMVDDDQGIRDVVSEFLGRHGYVVETAGDSREMDAALAKGAFDLIVLDVMLPGEDGLSICRRLAQQPGPPVIMLSAMGEDTDRIVGLELGADDYLPKPCNPRELLARVRAVLRRRETTPPPSQPADGDGMLRFAGWLLDTDGYALTAPDGTPVVLTTGEMRLIAVLARNARRLVSRDRLIEEIHGHDADQFDRAVDVAISRLRRKLAPYDGEALIRTVRGEGYMLAVPIDGSAAG